MFAVVEHGRIVELSEKKLVLPAALAVVDIGDASNIAVGWQQQADGSFRPPAAIEPTIQAQNAQGLALGLIEWSDDVILQCLEKGMAVPNEWRIYRDTLRSIAKSPPLDPRVRLARQIDLPKMPPVPPGVVPVRGGPQ